jgi:hypothetical protein
MSVTRVSPPDSLQRPHTEVQPTRENELINKLILTENLDRAEEVVRSWNATHSRAGWLAIISAMKGQTKDAAIYLQRQFTTSCFDPDDDAALRTAALLLEAYSRHSVSIAESWLLYVESRAPEIKGDVVEWKRKGMQEICISRAFFLFRCRRFDDCIAVLGELERGMDAERVQDPRMMRLASLLGVVAAELAGKKDAVRGWDKLGKLMRDYCLYDHFCKLLRQESSIESVDFNQLWLLMRLDEWS